MADIRLVGIDLDNPQPPDPAVVAAWTGTTASTLARGSDVATAQATAESAASVYVHDGDGYVLTGGRIFVGPEDPVDDGFTLVDGDQWLDPS